MPSGTKVSGIVERVDGTNEGVSVDPTVLAVFSQWCHLCGSNDFLEFVIKFQLCFIMIV